VTDKSGTLARTCDRCGAHYRAKPYVIRRGGAELCPHCDAPRLIFGTEGKQREQR